MVTAAKWGWVRVSLVALVAFLAARDCRASFHLTCIEQVIAGVNGDITAQAIQLRARAVGENLLMPARIRAWDAMGQNPIVIVDFTTSVPNGAQGARVLICTQ